ncbi:MAG: biotin transporter BioY [Chloroflexi bacterium]|nr:biotin transporter BioY [Chloroflexota bacterium]
MVVVGSLLVALTARVEVEIGIGPVPITGQTFGVLLIGATYGSTLGIATLTAYLIEGAVGLPVFAGGGSGVATLNGPTGGYLFGFAVTAYLVGKLAERGWTRSIPLTLLAMVIGNLVIYALGVARLQDFVGWEHVWSAGVRNFLPGDIVKILLAAGVLPGAWWIRERIGGLSSRG